MHDSYTLEQTINMIDSQAIKKKWKREPLYCIKRAHEELEEMEKAIKSGLGPEEISIEGVDVMYFLFQAISNSAPKIPLSIAFYKKYKSNWLNLKKTEDEFGKMVRR